MGGCASLVFILFAIGISFPYSTGLAFFRAGRFYWVYKFELMAGSISWDSEFTGVSLRGCPEFRGIYGASRDGWMGRQNAHQTNFLLGW